MHFQKKLHGPLLALLIAGSAWIANTSNAQETPSPNSEPAKVEAPAVPGAAGVPSGAPAAAPATPPAPQVDKGDTAWILTSAALVLMMTIPGLFLFYGGLVRGKNVLGTIMQSFVIVALISLQWILWGYSLAFGPDIGGIIGSLAWVGLNGVGTEPNANYAATIPHQTFMVYQMMFAIITPALITGAIADRAKFSTFIIFVLLWATFIYDPLAHWVWGKGWLRLDGRFGLRRRDSRSYQLRGIRPRRLFDVRQAHRLSA